jgi:4-hydroxymandelate oxidase
LWVYAWIVTFVNLADFEEAARDNLAQPAWDYYSSGANDELTVVRNRAAFAQRELHYRVLVDVSRRKLDASALGQPLGWPAIIAPTAFHKLAHPEGELATVRAAGATGTTMILSSLSNTAVEAVTEAATSPVWFQLYVYRDREATRDLVQRVEAAGCEALVLTVDAPLLGRRERDVKNRFALPEGLKIENMLAAGYGAMPGAGDDSSLAAYFASLLDPSLNWKDLEWLRSITRLPIVVKGIVRADDARLATRHGAAAIVVSNHGGRQLDTAPATLEVLEAVVEASDGAEVLMDGGIRRGTDIIKALALGARAVLIGRPVLWGLAANGQQGVSDLLTLLRDELDLAMALCGCPDVAAIDRTLLDP